jgi:transposase
MQDKELYQQILGLQSPWKVSDVELDHEAAEIRVRVAHPRGEKFCCPECNQELTCHDHAPERRWRHLDSCQFRTVLIAKTPRVKCPEHGVKTAAVPWAEKGSRFTMLFERFAIDVLLAAQTVKGAQSILRTNWDETWNILRRAVARGQSRKVQQVMPRIGIDEKAFRKGHNYISMVYDLEKGTVEAIADGNDTESGIACFSQLSKPQLDGVEAIAMDMSASFVKAAKASIPLAETKIVHDRFHVMQLVSKAVDSVRRSEHRDLKKAGDERLSGTKYLWLTSQENLSERQKERFEAAYDRELQTGKAWAFKELLRDLWNHDTAAEASVFFGDWYRRVIHTTLNSMKKVAKTIKKRLENVVSYCTHGITNAMAEGLNSKIMSIKRRVGGYRNRENFKTAIYFYCGGLDLYPR